jgi:bifunctional non-homologous end joining protein LigD
VKITHPDKVLFPADGITKGEMAEYYAAVAPVMLPHIVGRPVTMERFHRGIGEPGFYQKSVTKGFPAWLQRVAVPKKGGTVHHPIVTDVESLLWLANMNCITPHVWTARAPRLDPDILVFDLDPSEDDAPALRAATLLVRDTLAELGLTSWVKTSGSKGFHVVVPLADGSDYGDAGRFAHRFGRLLAQRSPDTFTQEFFKADRGRRILIDTGRNEFHATYAAAYAVRAKPGAPISAPCTWAEVESGSVAPQSLTLRMMAARIAHTGDAWSGLHAHGHDVRAASERLAQAAAGTA